MPRAPRPPRWPRLVLLGGSGLAVLLLIGIGREAVNRFEVQQEIRTLEDHITSLEQRRQDLTEVIDYFSSPLFQEQEARTQLGLAKTGENVVIVPLDDERTASEAPAVQRTNPEKWWNYFFPTL